MQFTDMKAYMKKQKKIMRVDNLNLFAPEVSARDETGILYTAHGDNFEVLFSTGFLTTAGKELYDCDVFSVDGELFYVEYDKEAGSWFAADGLNKLRLRDAVSDGEVRYLFNLYERAFVKDQPNRIFSEKIEELERA